MSPVGRRCSECGSSLAGKSASAKTCDEACRQKRSRRIKRANKQIREIQDQQGAGADEIAAMVRRESPDVIKDVMKAQLAPVVREALTEDVLRAVQQMLGLTPRAVELLQLDLESEDATVRQRAYTLVTKYTIGHPALLKADDTDGTKQLVVHFNLPRPGTEDPVQDGTADPVQDGEPLQVCDICNAEKPADEFVAGSSRCATCFEERRDAVLEMFA